VSAPGVTPPGFTGGRLDRADALRRDPAGLAAAAADPAARLLVLNDGLEPEVDAGGRLVWAHVPEGAALALLGLEDGAPRFVALGAGPGGGFRSPRLMDLLARMAPGEAATWAAARSVVDWHARHRFCANCAAATEPFRAGWGRCCPACGTEHFPRTDPVVIMLAEHRGRCLLGRQPSWPAGRYSALAGFVEPAESVEEAVAREVMEEAGVAVTAVRYVASQPWPFPSQLMIACVAEAADDALVLDRTELEDAIWVDRAAVRAALEGEGPFGAPPPHAIAHTLLRVWAAGGD